MGITWRHRITNEAVKQKSRDLIENYEPLVEETHRRQLQWFGNTRRLGSLAHDGLVAGQKQHGSLTWQSGWGLGWLRTGVTVQEQSSAFFKTILQVTGCDYNAHTGQT